MGIALLALSGLFKNLTSLPRIQHTVAKRHPGRMHPIWATRPATCLPQTRSFVHATPQAPSLRVLRIAEIGQSAECAGRMVISGRMADVCAELDRLAALEEQPM